MHWFCFRSNASLRVTVAFAIIVIKTTALNISLARLKSTFKKQYCCIYIIYGSQKPSKHHLPQAAGHRLNVPILTEGCEDEQRESDSWECTRGCRGLRDEAKVFHVVIDRFHGTSFFFNLLNSENVSTYFKAIHFIQLVLLLVCRVFFSFSSIYNLY